MSEAELIESFQGYLGLIHELLFGYVGIISAFLIMSYLVAHKLSRLLSSVVLTLFTAISFSLIFRIYLQRVDTFALMAYIQEHKIAGDLDLNWWGNNPLWVGQLNTLFDVIVTIGGYVGCIIFFLYQRKTETKYT